MCIVTTGDEIINEIIRGCVGIAAIIGKIRKNRLRFFGNVINWSDWEAVRMAIKRNVERKIERGRLKEIWYEEWWSGGSYGGVGQRWPTIWLGAKKNK